MRIRSLHVPNGSIPALAGIPSTSVARSLNGVPSFDLIA